MATAAHARAPSPYGPVPRVHSCVVVPAPYVTGSNPSNGPAIGGTSVTINGLYFGTVNDGSPTASVAGVPCGTTAWTASTTLLCLLPLGGSATASLAVTYGALVGNGPATFTYDSSGTQQPPPRSDRRMCRQGPCAARAAPERALYTLGTLGVLRRVPAVAFQADPHPLATAAL